MSKDLNITCKLTDADLVETAKASKCRPTVSKIDKISAENRALRFLRENFHRIILATSARESQILKLGHKTPNKLSKTSRQVVLAGLMFTAGGALMLPFAPSITRRYWGSHIELPDKDIALGQASPVAIANSIASRQNLVASEVKTRENLSNSNLENTNYVGNPSTSAQIVNVNKPSKPAKSPISKKRIFTPVPADTIHPTPGSDRVEDR